MFTMNWSTPKLSSETWLNLEQIVERFEMALRKGLRPSLNEFLQEPHIDRQILLIELIHVDLEYRFEVEDALTVENYLESYPEIATDSDAVLQLIALEHNLRARRNPSLGLEDYLRRFPHLGEELRSHWQVNPEAEAAVEGKQAPPKGKRLPYSSRNAETVMEPNRPLKYPKVGIQVPGYEVLKELGKGGMGVVYQARHLNLNRLVALKMIRSGEQASSEDIIRFLNEAEAVARVRHPNIVQVFDVGRVGDRPYFTMEFVEGGSLAQKLTGTPQQALTSAHLVEELAKAIHLAHQHGIVHRDLKPANVLLAADGTPKITDFGLAKRLEGGAGLTQSNVIMGTPSYMAPEQAAGKSSTIGPVTDVYALGAILYELVTGRPPFKAASSWDTIAQVLSDDPVPPSRLQPKMPRDLNTICLKALEKEPARRYPTAEKLAEDLRRFQAGEPILARPASVWERTIKWARRKPYQAALAGALSVLCAVIVSSILVYQAQQASIFKDKYDRLEGANKVREGVEQLLQAARQSEALQRWNEAKNALDKALAALGANPDLQGEELRTELTQRLQVVQERLHEEAQRQEALDRQQRFRPYYDEALLHVTPSTGQDLADNRARTRAGAHKALAIYKLEADNEGGAVTALLEHDRKYLPTADFTRLTQRCYELLLIWADAEAVLLPNQKETADEVQARATRGLHLLRRAAHLGELYLLTTQAYHIHKASYTALSKGEKIDPGLPKGAPAAPTGALDWFLKGLESYRKGLESSQRLESNRAEQHYADARDECTHAVNLQEDHFWARYVRALCFLKLGNLADGKADLTVCLDRRRGFVWALLLRGFASSELGKRYKAQREFEAAEADFNQALEDRDPLVRYAGLNNRGVLFIRQQRWAQAIADLQEAVQLKQEALPGYINLAKAYEGAQRWDRAITALDQAVKLAPNLELLYEDRSQLHLLRNDRAAARTDLARAIKRYPKGSQEPRLVDNHVLLGQLLGRDELHEEALKQFAAALKIQPKCEPAYRLQAESLLALNHRKEAGEALDSYLELATQPSADVFKARGLIHTLNREYPGAVEMYTLALHQAPADRETRNLRGWSYLLMDAAQPALKDFEEALKGAPKNADALAGRGNARIRLRQRQEAVADAEAALKEGPQTDRLLYNVTCIYALAVAQTELEVRAGRDPKAPARLELYEKKAFDCLVSTLQARPEKEAAFWREVVQNDPALASIRRGKIYLQLDRKYGSK